MYVRLEGKLYPITMYEEDTLGDSLVKDGIMSRSELKNVFATFGGKKLDMKSSIVKNKLASDDIITINRKTLGGADRGPGTGS